MRVPSSRSPAFRKSVSHLTPLAEEVDVEVGEGERERGDARSLAGNPPADLRVVSFAGDLKKDI